MVDTLLLLSAAGLGRRVAIARLVSRRVQRGRSVSVARASLTRCLRRLWRLGLVELENDWGRSLTSTLAAINQKLAVHEADPEGKFAEYQAARQRGVPGFYGSQDAVDHLAWARWQAARERRRPMRATHVLITECGCEVVNSAPAGNKPTNNKGAMSRDNLSGTTRTTGPGQRDRTPPPLGGVPVPPSTLVAGTSR